MSSIPAVFISIGDTASSSHLSTAASDGLSSDASLSCTSSIYLETALFSSIGKISIRGFIRSNSSPSIHLSSLSSYILLNSPFDNLHSYKALASSSGIGSVRTSSRAARFISIGSVVKMRDSIIKMRFINTPY